MSNGKQAGGQPIDLQTPAKPGLGDGSQICGVIELHRHEPFFQSSLHFGFELRVHLFSNRFELLNLGFGHACGQLLAGGLDRLHRGLQGVVFPIGVGFQAGFHIAERDFFLVPQFIHGDFDGIVVPAPYTKDRAHHGHQTHLDHPSGSGSGLDHGKPPFKGACLILTSSPPIRERLRSIRHSIPEGHPIGQA